MSTFPFDPNTNELAEFKGQFVDFLENYCEDKNLIVEKTAEQIEYDASTGIIGNGAYIWGEDYDEATFIIENLVSNVKEPFSPYMASIAIVQLLEWFKSFLERRANYAIGQDDLTDLYLKGFTTFKNWGLLNI